MVQLMDLYYNVFFFFNFKEVSKVFCSFKKVSHVFQRSGVVLLAKDFLRFYDGFGK